GVVVVDEDRDLVARGEAPSSAAIARPEERRQLRDGRATAATEGVAQLPSLLGTGDGGGTRGLAPGDKVTVFVDNHDTERSHDDSLNLRDDGAAFVLANLFMLAQPYGRAQLQSGYVVSPSRLDADAPASSPFDASGEAVIGRAWDFVHRLPGIAPMVAFRNAMDGLPMTRIRAGNAHQLAFARGTAGFVVINADEAPWNASFDTGLPAGSYCNLAHGGRTDDGRGCEADRVVVDGGGRTELAVGGVRGAAVAAVVLASDSRILP
ncbi:hypothetical protein EON77_06150, partial [bacterium]